MNSRNTPDRVHVVRPPENQNDEAPTARSAASVEVIRTLAKISDKLKRSEAERYELLAELRDYRQSLRELEDRSEASDKNYAAMASKVKSNALDNTVSERQRRFEKSLKAAEDKMVKTVAGQAVLNKRLQDAEDKQIAFDQRLDQSATEQTKLDRKVDLLTQDKNLMMRKVERLEEIITETQNLLRERDVLMIAQQQAKKEEPAVAPAALSAPVWDNIKSDMKPDADDKNDEKSNEVLIDKDGLDMPTLAGASNNNDQADDEGYNWGRIINVQTMSTVGLILVALLLGWAINQVQKRDNEAAQTAQLSAELTDGQNDITAEPVGLSTNPVPDNVLDYSDDQLLDALEADPDALAAQLNNIAPGANEETATAPIETDVMEEQVADITADQNLAIANPSITPEIENFNAIAYRQDPDIVSAIAREKGEGSLTERVQRDADLPAEAKRIEIPAFAGNGEAQHDLAAAYTSGQAGVTQNFERAAIWFREAAGNNIANAAYNLGVLNHQGLGRDRDMGRALYWYREAAKLSHAEAQYNHGIAYIEGIGTEFNAPLAAAFFERAANNGIMEAAYNLGLIHDNGLMGQSKPEEALLWYKIAADQGSSEAQAALDQLAQNMGMEAGDVDALYTQMQNLNEAAKGRRAGPVIGGGNQSSSLQNDNNLVRQIQEYLMLTGSFAGPADGIKGVETVEAIRAYQAGNGLSVDGQISKTLLESMVGGARARLNNGGV